MATFGRIQEISHEIGDAGELALSVTSADVRLTTTPGSAVHVRATFEVSAGNDADADAVFEANKLRITASKNALRLSEADGDHGLGGAFSRFLGGQGVDLVSVEIEAPPATRLEIRAVSGDVQATGFVGAQRYQTVSGDLRLIDAGGDLNTDAVSGDVSVRAERPVSLRSNTVSGDLSVDGPTYTATRANSVSGDVSIEGTLEPGGAHSVDTVSGDLRLASAGGVTVVVRGLSGDVHSALPHRLEGSPDRRRLVVGDGAATLTFNSMSGDVAVVAARRPSAIASQPTAASMSPPPAEAPDATLDVLGALERGEIDVDEAMRRLGGSS